MKSFLTAGAVLVLTLAAAPALAATNLVSNGDFDAGFTDWTASGWGIKTGEYGNASNAASANCVGDPCVHDAQGDVHGESFLYQDISTSAGGVYRLTFDYASAGDPMELVAVFGGANVFDHTGLATSYATYTVDNIQAAGALTRLAFYARQDPGHSGLDNVSLVQTGGFATTGGVPEPDTWALMILGLGGVGAVARARRGPRAAPI